MSRFTSTNTSSSHHLQLPTTSHPPPSSFRGTGGIRNSLKKIPSSFFGEKAKKDKDKFTIHMDDTTTTPVPTFSRSLKSAAVPAFLANNASPPRQDKEKSKLQKKPKTRKGLGEIFGWSNSSSSNSNNTTASISPPIISAPSALMPSPSRLPKENTNIVMPRQARRTSSKSSIPGLAGWTSLRPPAETPAKSRPSMAADPFGRTDVGAERVDQIQQCGELYERRGSVSSGKAFSAKTMDSGSADTHMDRHNRNSVSSGKALSSKTFGTIERPGSITSSKAISTKTVDSDYTIRFQGQAEIRRAKHMSPVPARATLVELPSRANSTIRRPSDPIPSPRQLAVSAQSSVADRTSVPAPCPPVTKMIKKEKTKSRVWGLLGIKSRKSKDVLTGKGAVAAVPATVTASPPRHTIKASIRDALTPSKVPKRVSSIHALNTAITVKPTARSTTRRGAVPVPPSLHITQPSVDIAAGPASGSTVASHERATDFGPDSNGITGLLSNRMPKRKSLNGLFGLSLKEAEAFEHRHQYQEDDHYDATPEQDTSSHQFQDIKPRSNTLRRVASATDKLVDLVTAFELSPVSRKTITPMESLSSIAETIKEAHEGSPTPMRKVKSAVLSIRAGVSPMRQGPNVSPLKLALHRKQVETPAKAILSRKSSHNIFAPVEPIAKIVTTVDKFATLRGDKARAFLQPPARVNDVSAETAARTTAFPPAPVEVTAPAGLPPPPRPARRNVFAPPTPKVSATKLASLDFTDETVGMPKLRPISGASAFTDRVEHDVPQDLRDLFLDADFTSSATASPMSGLPQPPSSNRLPTSARRRRNPAPATASGFEDSQRYLSTDDSPQRPQIESVRGSMQSEFDFDYEFAKLNKGTQRASFVEALQKAQDHCSQSSHDLPPLPPLPAPPARYGEFRNSQFDDAASERASERGSKSSTDTVVVAAAARRSPFMGTFAFQQHASHIRRSHSPQPAEHDLIPAIAIEDASRFLDQDEQELDQEDEHHGRYSLAEDETMELAPPLQTRYHRRDESGVSIATMSSIGEVIETGIAGDYTNYFDVEFARDNAKKLDTAPARPAAESHSRQSSIASTASAHARGHRRGHSRNTSIVSLASIDGLEQPFRTAAGPPVSLHNLKRSSYISKHRQSGSSYEAASGRSDWAAEHRRNFSDESVMSNFSACRIARPGLGDRMFQLDGGVQLTSITASPPDYNDNGNSNDESSESETEEEEEQAQAGLNVSKSTFYTAYDGREASFHTALDTSLNGRESNYGDMSSSDEQHDSRPISTSSTPSSVQSSSGDSIFGPNPARVRGNFLLRPISAITTDSSSNEEDTFVNVMRGQGQISIKRAPSCIEGQGEETITPVNVARPRKPRSDRRRIVQLALESDLETPGLTSPSASEASSRMSLETRLSEGPPIRAFFAGHRRQRSSAAVQPQATIKEEPSAVTLRQSPLEWKEVGTVRSYLDWEREADVECRKVRTQWSDSDESKLALQDFKAPTSQQAIAEFLAQSSKAYGPLKQQQLPKAHRRKSSLSEARASLSPYGHPLARPPVHGGIQYQAPPQVQIQRKTEGQAQKPRMSLTTKFERNNSNSATSPHFPSDDEPTSQPTSAIFAQFTRDTPPTPPPVLMELPNMSPFKMNMGTGYSPDPKKGAKEKEEKRQRVDSEVRRQALGWGKRRNSDGPTKVIGTVEPVPKIPLAFLKPRVAARDKENIRPTASPTKKAMPVTAGTGARLVTKKSNNIGGIPAANANSTGNAKRPARRVPRLASVPKGLRA